MKSSVNIIKAMLKDIEKLDKELFVYASLESFFVQVSVSKFEFYMDNENFKKVCEKWRTVFNKMGLKIIFVCGWVPKEERLVELMNKNSLILNN